MMRRLLITSFLLFSTIVLACDTKSISCMQPPARATLLFRPLSGLRPATFAFRNNLLQVHSFAPVRFYPGIRFDDRAVFCRMENYFLTTYNVKFSIHAGGYRE